MDQKIFDGLVKFIGDRSELSALGSVAPVLDIIGHLMRQLSTSGHLPNDYADTLKAMLEDQAKHLDDKGPELAGWYRSAITRLFEEEETFKH